MKAVREVIEGILFVLLIPIWYPYVAVAEYLHMREKHHVKLRDY